MWASGTVTRENKSPRKNIENQGKRNKKKIKKARRKLGACIPETKAEEIQERGNGLH